MSSNGEETDDHDHDPRSERDREYDAIVDLLRQSADQVHTLSDLVKTTIERGGTTQTVIHKTEGMGTVGIVCTTISACCLLFIILGLILGAVFIVPDIHDVKAWQDIMRKDIARLQAGQQQLEKRQ